MERRLKYFIKKTISLNHKKNKYDHSVPKNYDSDINIKKEITLSILNIGEILAKTIDYYSLRDRKNDLNEFIELCNQQSFKEKINPQNKNDKLKSDDNYLKNSICQKSEEDPLLNSISKQKFQKSFVSFRSCDKKSSYSLNHLISDVDKKVKILNGVFTTNDYNNLSDESTAEVEIKKLNEIKTNETFSYLYERMDLFEEMKQLNEIMNDLNLIVDKNDHNLLNYGTFI